MASENSSVLFQTRPHVGLSPTYTTAAEGRETWPLLHALAATLDDPNPLNQLTEVLGIHLGAGACLLLSYFPSTDSLSYACWHHGAAPTSRCLGMGDASSSLDGQRRGGLGLIQQTIDHASGKGRLHWQKGLLELLRDKDGAPAWLRTMATCTAIAVDGAGLQGAILLLGTGGIVLEQTVQANLASLGAIAFQQAHLQGQAQRHTEQLRYLNYLKEDFLSTLNHELRTPLTSMMLAIRMLRRPDLTPERITMYLDILEQQCSREINLVNDLLMLQSLESKTFPRGGPPIDLGQLVSDQAARGQPEFEQARLTVDLQLPAEPVMLAIDSERLIKVLQELLANARKYSAPETAVTLALLNSPDHPHRVIIQITNQGAAIEAQELPYIFDKFRRGRNATKDGIAGTGAGLALVQGIVKQLEGTITVSSQPGDDELWQTCFTLELDCHDKST